MELMCCWKFSTHPIFCIRKFSSMYLFHNMSGFSAVLSTLDSKASMYKLIAIALGIS